MKPFDGSIHYITTPASHEQIGDDKPVWDEGYSIAESADKKHLLLQVHDRRGDVARITLTLEQAFELSKTLGMSAVMISVMK